MNDNLKKAQKKASSPEARAKAVATMKRRREEAKAGLGPALLAHAKMVTKGKKKKGRPKKAKGIPLDLIPDRPKKKGKPPSKPAKNASRQEVVLALLRYLNGE